MRTGKFNNRRTTIDGVTFDSIAEAARYRELKFLERAGEIQGLRLQPEYPLHVQGFLVCKYRGDFAYIENGKSVVEDVKSPATCTPLYRLKAKLMLAIYGIRIRETMAAGRRRAA